MTVIRMQLLHIYFFFSSRRRHTRLVSDWSSDVCSSDLGAHVVPEEFRKKADGAKRYIQLLEENLLPTIAEHRLAEFCDVFCDRGAFSAAESKRVLQAGRQWGLAPRIHAEQLSRSGATRLAILLRAASCDHLEHVNKSDIRALGKSETVATLLPGCDFHLGWKKYARARALIDAGAIVALATD